MLLKKCRFHLINIGVLLLCAGSSIAQTEQSTSPAWDVSICPVKLLVGTQDFVGQIRFTVKTDGQGKVISVSELGRSPLYNWVDTQKFPPCIKGWRLSSLEDHIVTIGVATIFTDRKNNFISISNKTQKLKINLPVEIFTLSDELEAK
jgi:hypothetical protein